MLTMRMMNRCRSGAAVATATMSAMTPTPLRHAAAPVTVPAAFAVPSANVSIRSSSLVFSSPVAFTSATTTTIEQRRFNASAAAASAATPGSETALDVAMKVNKLKRMHQSGQGKKDIEALAWRELNTLSEQQIAMAEGKAVALLLNSWAYFARFWEKGKDGPITTATEGDQQPPAADTK